MSRLGEALFAMGKTTVLGNAENRTVDPPRAGVARGIFQPQLFNKGTYGEAGRYYFPDHPDKQFIRGVTAGHAIEGEILKRVAQHVADPFGLKMLGIDNRTWEPDWDDIHDMAYVEWAGGRSVYSEIERAGGLLDQLNLRDAPFDGKPDKPADDIVGLREQLKLAQDSWTKVVQIREKEKMEVLSIIESVSLPTEKGGRFANALRKIQKVYET